MSSRYLFRANEGKPSKFAAYSAVLIRNNNRSNTILQRVDVVCTQLVRVIQEDYLITEMCDVIGKLHYFIYMVYVV